jgi:DNA polymerase-3 subunit gamma/tau
MTQALYRKYRPSRWDQVFGQQHIVQTLHNAVAADRVGHAYLFAGPRGTGKTSVARILAKAVNCLDEDPKNRPCDKCEHCKAVNKGAFLDLIEIDAASNTSVEDVRDLRDKINFSPNQGRYKIYIIDEVHMLSTAAFNALLKTLEEPPPHAIFVLATTEVHKIPATVLSRCQRHEFRRIPVVDILAQLEEIAKAEKIKVEKEAMYLIARQATGGMRDAVSLLDQLSALGDKVSLDMTQRVLGTVTSQAVLDLIDAVQDQDPAAGLNTIHSTLDAGSDPRQFARQVVDYLRSVLLVRMGNADQVDTTAEIRQHMVKHAQGFEGSELLAAIRTFNQAASEARSSWQPSLPIELAFVEAMEGPALEASAPTPPSSEPRSKKRPASPAVKKAAGNPQPKEEETAPPPKPNGGKLNNQQWQQMLTLVREQSPNTNGLLNSCKTREVRQGTLYLGFASEVLREKMAEEDHLNVVKQMAEQVLGEKVEVECIISAGNQASLPPDVDSSGMVATGMRLGGEIVDVNDLGAQPEE